MLCKEPFYPLTYTKASCIIRIRRERSLEMDTKKLVIPMEAKLVWELKAQAAKENKTLKVLVNEMIQEYLRVTAAVQV